ncbi:hypothetical protein CHS0354_026705 [Potamilus streckersoni]|uniref:Carbohydrate sulfotransferase n=1 Tax=Potamilus streckersoni TaxID=2493646 RepID=A0AAE0S874_9BIVA|nr:hypothetical protein CHS0354_026705 [Potamilus streckersoni]
MEFSVSSIRKKVNRKTLPQNVVDGLGEDSLGEQIAAKLKYKCNKIRRFPSRQFVMSVTTNKMHRLLYCPMCKLASTFWTRFFMMLNLQNVTAEIYLTPYDVPLSLAPPTRERLINKNGLQIPNASEMYGFLFVRNPYSRILSAYVDKLFAPNPIFWKIGKKIVGPLRNKTVNGQRKDKCGSDVTFSEYVQAVTKRHLLNGSIDCHDADYMSYCHVCDVAYKFVGRLESFYTDAFFLFKQLNLNETLKIMRKEMKLLSDQDAVLDSVSSAYKWRKDIEKCISWDAALRRVWKKLQIRGIIGKDKYPLSESESKQITRDDFIKLVMETQERTPYALRKNQRNQAFVEIFRTVPLEVLKDFKTAFEHDFYLFEYDPSPKNIFSRIDDIEYFGYLDLK